MSHAPLLRPTLLPGLARLWRDRHTLQLGLDPARAILLEVTNPLLVRLLDLLDGTHSERAVLDRAVQLGVPREDGRVLLDRLRAAGLLVGGQALLPTQLPEPVRRRLIGEAVALALHGADPATNPARILRRRSVARIVITGPGRLAAPVAIAVAQAGVGGITLDLSGRVQPTETPGTGLLPDDTGRQRTEAVADALARTAPGTQVRSARGGRATLVVQVGMDRPAPLVAAGYAQRRQPHLMLELRDGVAVVGPFVPAIGTPCLNCRELHRQDRDPGWPGLAAQLMVPGMQPCATPTLLAATGYAAAEILRHVDGGTPETVGGAAEIPAPGRIRHRAWPPHPRCGCRRGRSGPARSTGMAVAGRPGRSQ
ncbi:hypothetical protein [Plantactinospora sp. GCM10030261]|uniref:hypothetical protein n=1 Tax=Plantactinospora sp. GCM10030261 TaxID=3273420 RepID=UPI00361D72DC